MSEECRLCGGLEAVTIVVPHGGLDKDTEYSDCPCCIERIWTADEAKLKARIAELERQQTVLVEALETIKHSMMQASVLGNDVRREVRLSGETARAALAAVKGKTP